MENSTEFNLLKLCQFIVYKLKKPSFLETPYTDYATQLSTQKLPALDKSKNSHFSASPATSKHLLNSKSATNGFKMYKISSSTHENFNRQSFSRSQVREQIE